MKKIVEYNATTDLIFKGVFTLKKPLTELLSIILNEKVNDKDIIIERDTIDDDIIKTPRFDVKIKMSLERNIVLEMQKVKPNYNMIDRLIYYAARQYTGSIKKGKDYETKESIVICFTGFDIINEKCMNTYVLKNEENEELVGIKIITIQFTKINK